MVVSVGAFVGGDVRKAVVRSDSVRALALDIAYGIPGYKDADLSLKNWVFDGLKKAVDAVGKG